MTDIYAPYRAMLAGKDVPITDNNPYPGRYKMKRGGAWLPVAIGPDGNGGIAALVDGVAADPLEIWTWAAKWPVAQDDYRFRVAHGHWPDEPKPAVRSNMPADPFDSLVAEMEDKSAQADDLLTKNPEIKSQQVCDLARNLQAQLLDLNKRADTMHEVEKRPVLEKGKEIDERFRFRAAVKVLSERLRQRFGAFLAVEERRQREAAQREFEAKRAAVEAERQRIEAERAKQKEDEPVAFHTTPEPELPELPSAPDAVKVSAGGGFGRKAGLRTEYVPQIDDYRAALLHFAEHPDVHAAVLKAVKQAVKTSKGTVKIPGVRVIEERKAA